VHRLVALSFLENKFGSEAHVDHKDKDPSNNHLRNLQWLLPNDHIKKDHGISVTEVKDNGEVNIYDMLTDAANEINANIGQISYAIKNWQHFRGSYWYKTNEYNDELHKQKIDELNNKNNEKQIKKLNNPKKKKKRNSEDNKKRKEKNKLDKEKFKNILNK
jgi:hypothetical protein